MKRDTRDPKKRQQTFAFGAPNPLTQKVSPGIGEFSQMAVQGATLEDDEWTNVGGIDVGDW